MTKPSNFAADVQRVANVITQHAAVGSGSANQARLLRKLLLELVETGICRPRLRRFAADHRGLVCVLERLCNHADEHQLGRALYGLMRLNQTEHYALDSTGAKESDLKVARDLAEGIGAHAGSFVEKLPRDTSWIADVLASADETVVIVDQRAAEDMLLAALEGYRVPRGRGSKYTEVYGICLGTVREVPRHVGGRGDLQKTYVHVARCAAQLRAKASSKAVWPSDRSLQAQLDAAADLFPHLAVVGDFHSHPWDDLDQLQDNGWRYSEPDEKYNRNWTKALRVRNQDPRTGLIVAIAQKRRKRKGGFQKRYGRYTHQLTVGSHQCVLAAYRILTDGRYSDERTSLHCTARIVE